MRWPLADELADELAGCQTKAPGGATPAKAEAQAQAQGQAARRRQGGMNTSWCCPRWQQVGQVWGEKGG
jgi:hypothetical protein